ncbi:hypothetical protein CEE37_12230 [candidate division LCP-89 bacterium B3_LCP]|uniref:Uncharacterized protein n=1 Tax=candidate division LCP-89 bacterium B3_LCP TaxID=2012998 RepID=A0A532UUA7_UNCL8|nr:MAG: hypothetical protein CEE37_12230 [candidate division LCP-89 bacterium B3_LCP]
MTNPRSAGRPLHSVSSPTEITHNPAADKTSAASNRTVSNTASQNRKESTKPAERNQNISHTTSGESTQKIHLKPPFSIVNRSEKPKAKKQRKETPKPTKLQSKSGRGRIEKPEEVQVSGLLKSRKTPAQENRPQHIEAKKSKSGNKKRERRKRKPETAQIKAAIRSEPQKQSDAQPMMKEIPAQKPDTSERRPLRVEPIESKFPFPGHQTGEKQKVEKASRQTSPDEEEVGEGTLLAEGEGLKRGEEGYYSKAANETIVSNFNETSSRERVQDVEVNDVQTKITPYETSHQPEISRPLEEPLSHVESVSGPEPPISHEPTVQIGLVEVIVAVQDGHSGRKVAHESSPGDFTSRHYLRSV